MEPDCQLETGFLWKISHQLNAIMNIDMSVEEKFSLGEKLISQLELVNVTLKPH